jgi:hypothetical protein
MVYLFKKYFRSSFRISWKHGWHYLQKSHGLPNVMQSRKPVFAIDYHAVEISRHGEGR